MDIFNDQPSLSGLQGGDRRIATGLQFLEALFDPFDIILFRPIETWSEGGKNRSRVLYKETRYAAAVAKTLHNTLKHQHKVSADENANIFFGVCPRLARNGRFDLAWQIRTVRAMWTDIDQITVDEARTRIDQTGLPQPSIIVNSGNGVHLYWLLDKPYLIDDARDPPAVETEWIQLPGGRRKPRKYFVAQGDRVYLDQQRHTSRLSGKAQHVQDVLAGIAKVIGGDHTTDLARLLRVPGTLNRKGERNGREPISTVLVECESARRYGFAEFERFTAASPETERVRKVAVMPLPKPRRLSAAIKDKLAELVAACAIAPVGNRSERDFALCCHAVNEGIDKERVWRSVEQVGKFAEQGRRYFEVTWEKAQTKVRSKLYDTISSSDITKTSATACSVSGKHCGGGSVLGTDRGDDGCGRPTIKIDASTTPVAETLRQITDCLIAAKDCFLRCGQLVLVNSDDVSSILTAPELAGLLNQHVEFQNVSSKSCKYEPLSPKYGGTYLNQHVELARLPEINLFTRNPVFTLDWRLTSPGFDPESGIYYTGQKVAIRDDTSHLDTLLQDFCFRSTSDRTNFLGVLLTAVLMPHFIGSKPAVLFNGNQPGLGKTILAQVIAILRDGRPTETASYNSHDEEFEKRLGAMVRRGATTIVIDNAKGSGRRPRIESACLERSITDRVLSYRLLGKSQEIRAENSHIFCITANSPDVSPDLLSRSVVINLEHEGDPRRRLFHIADPEGYAEQYRTEILGELLGMVEQWRAAGMPRACVSTRFDKRGWGGIVGGILQCNGKPDFLANAEEASAQLDSTRREFTELVVILADHPKRIWTATELAELCAGKGLLAADLGEGTPRSLATKMGTLAGRYIDESFDTPDGRSIGFFRSRERKNNVYHVNVMGQVPNLESFAEPLPNLGDPQVRHH